MLPIDKLALFISLNFSKDITAAIYFSVRSTKLTFDLKHLLKAKKVNGYVKNIFGKEKSCPTWRFKEDPKNFTITVTPGQQQIEEKKDDEN